MCFYCLYHQALMSQGIQIILQRWAKYESNVIFVNRLIHILSLSLVIQDYYNDTLPDSALCYKNSFGVLYCDFTGDVNNIDYAFSFILEGVWMDKHIRQTISALRNIL